MNATAHLSVHETPDTDKPVTLLVAPETQAWLEALYGAGAVTYDVDGTVYVNPAVRGLVSQMHTVLAAGDATRQAKLDAAFDEAVAATSALGAKLGSGVLSV